MCKEVIYPQHLDFQLNTMTLNGVRLQNNM